MGGVTEFLESSTIHGLVYLARTQKLSRLFWMLVVMTGFTVAGYLIQQSFADWASNPVSTTLKTFSIDEISFPRVTVCPPRETVPAST